jgi:hypothetical protein
MNFVLRWSSVCLVFERSDFAATTRRHHHHHNKYHNKYRVDEEGIRHRVDKGGIRFRVCFVCVLLGVLARGL